MAKLQCSDLAVGYEEHIVADHITFHVNDGDYLCIIGENGAGKSTLIKTILGLIAPIHGSIGIGNKLCLSSIGYLPQQTPIQRDFPASVREVVLSGFQGKKGLRPFYSRDERKTAKTNMDRMGITRLEKKCYRELSGGQQQRVLLARALCAAKDMLLLDEPVAGLDPMVTADLYRLISDLNNEGTSIIMVTHDLSAIRYASHILHVSPHPFFGTKEAFFADEAERDYINKAEVAAK